MLMLVLPASATSCLLEAPVELAEPDRVAPQALIRTALPSVFSPYQTYSTGIDPAFQVKFTSKDLGESIVGRLYLNYNLTDAEKLIGSVEVPAGTSTSDAREIIVPWGQGRGSTAPGCYSVTLVIAHKDNYTSAVIPAVIEPDMAEFLTWWIAHDSAPQAVSLEDCYPDGVPLSTQP
jgi:hypothetical protein